MVCIGRTTRICLSWLIVFAAGLHLATGCGVINPSLLGTTGANTTASLPGPEGSIVIVVFNYTSSETIRTNVNVVKNNGAVLPLSILTSIGTHSARVQDCDLSVVQVQEVVTQDVNDQVFTTPASVAPMIFGNTLQCGDVIAITVTGTPISVLIDVKVF